jgi:hypothetical protein
MHPRGFRHDSRRLYALVIITSGPYHQSHTLDVDERKEDRKKQNLLRNRIFIAFHHF